MPIARIQMPDGRIGRFEVPEGTTPEQVTEYANQNSGEFSQKIGLQAEPQKPASFLEEMGANFEHGIQSGADLLAGRYQDIGRTSPTPKTEALGDKLFPPGSSGSFMDAVSNTYRNTTPNDWAGALTEKFGETSMGKALSTIGGVHPVFNAVSTTLNRYVNPFIREKTGIGEDTLNLIELGLPTLGLKKAGSVADPLINKTGQFVKSEGFKNLMADSTSGKPVVAEATPTQGKISPAMEKIYQRIKSDTGNDLNRTLNSYASKQGKSLVEAGGERTANLAEGASQYPSGAATSAEFFKGKVEDAPDVMKSSLSKNVDANTAYYKTIDDIVSEGQAEAAPLYRQAFKANQVIDSPVIDKILNTPTGREALARAARDAADRMSLMAKPDAELTALARELADIGVMEKQGKVARGLKLRTLDFVKKSMDKQINDKLRSQTPSEANNIIALKNGLVSELDRLDKTGLYAKARGVAGDYLSGEKAMESGLKFLSEDPELVGRNYRDYSPAEKRAYKIGAVKALRNNIENKYDGHNVARLFDKPSNRQRLSSILNEREYKSLLADAEATDKIFQLRNQIIGNSRTALRQVARDEFDVAGQQLLQQVAQRGWRSVVTSEMVNFMKRRFDGLNDKMANDVAKILYETDPKAKYKIVKELSNRAAMEGKNSSTKKSLQIYFDLNDGVSKFKSGLIGGASGLIGGAIGVGTQKNGTPTQILINPNQPNPYQQREAPKPQSSNTFDKIKQAESGGNPNARNPNSTASGLYQFTDATWMRSVNKWGKELGITYKDKNNPQAQEVMARKLAADNAKILTSKLGRAPDKGEMYAAHFMGAGKATKLIEAQGTGANAVAMFPKEARSNKSIFYDRMRPRTVEEVYGLLSSKIS